MFDQYIPHQFFHTLTFSFRSSRFEIWQKGVCVSNENCPNLICAKENVKEATTTIGIFGTFPSIEINEENTFEKIFTLSDRLLLVSIPEPSSHDIVAFLSLRQTSGITNPGKRFKYNEPYCCSLFTINHEIKKITFSFSNPEKLIEFYIDDQATKQNPSKEIEVLSEKILFDVKNEELNSARQRMLQLFATIKANPSLLAETTMPDILGKAFVLMLNNRISSDDDTIEAIACIAYVLISKAILQNPNPNHYLDRLLIIEFSRDEFNYSIRSALDVSEGGRINFFEPEGQMGGTKARDGIFKMEIADLYSNPILYQQVELFRNKKNKFDRMIADNFFYNKTLNDLITEGNENHEKAYKYFYNKILVNHNIEI